MQGHWDLGRGALGSWERGVLVQGCAGAGALGPWGKRRAGQETHVAVLRRERCGRQVRGQTQWGVVRERAAQSGVVDEGQLLVLQQLPVL